MAPKNFGPMFSGCRFVVMNWAALEGSTTIAYRGISANHVMNVTRDWIRLRGDFSETHVTVSARTVACTEYTGHIPPEWPVRRLWFPLAPDRGCTGTLAG